MSKADVWVVIPAAGIGTRMNADIPKQYLTINNRTVLQHSIEAFMPLPFVKGILVAIAKNDSWFTSINFSDNIKLQHCIGGKERYDTVLNTLKHFNKQIEPNDWILVHDAARPCVTASDIIKLYQQCQHHKVGGILATPVKDTIKQSSNNTTITKTVDRNQLWHALTPQMFRHQQLINAIEQSIKNQQHITDDASAFENQSQQPLLISGSDDNIKITRPSDLHYATWIINQRATNV